MARDLTKEIRDQIRQMKIKSSGEELEKGKRLFLEALKKLDI